MRNGVLAAAVLFGLAVLAHAEPPATVSPQVKAFNAHLAETTTGAEGVFATEPDGGIRHMPSDLVCPAEFPGFHLMDLQIYAAPGTDVGCDYSRIGVENKIVSKLTIFLVQAAPGATLDIAFDRYRGEITGTFPSAAPMKAALQIGERTDYRAAGYTIQDETGQHHTELVVGLTKGWIVEIRATYANSVIQVRGDTPKEEIAGQLYDIENTYVAYMSVMGLH